MIDRRLRVAALTASLLGVAIAGYLTYVHYSGLQPFCAGSGHGCERVQSSVYAQLAGIPVALLGLAGYVAIVAAVLAPGELPRLISAGLAVSGFGFSVYLTYLELNVVDAICQWCVGSALLMTTLAMLTVWRLLGSDDADRAIDADSRDAGVRPHAEGVDRGPTS